MFASLFRNLKNRSKDVKVAFNCFSNCLLWQKQIHKMALYHYTIKDRKITTTQELETMPDGFNAYAISFGAGDIYYKLADGQVCEVVCDIELGERKSIEEVQSFLDNLLLD